MAAFTPTGVELLVKGSDKFFGTLGKANKGIVGFGKTMAKAAVAGTAALGVAIAGVGVAMVKLASDAAELEGIKSAFEGIAASAEGGQARMLAALKEGSLGMVTQRDLMATYNEAAMLVSNTFAQQLPDAMGFLSKVSVATGQDMGFMMDSLVKGVGRLSPMILDNLGIQVTLADATANAAAQFGIEADELSKTQIQAGMMNVTLEKLAENTADMPEVAGTAAQAQAAFGVALKDTKDAIGLALLPAFTSLMKVVTKFATDNLPKLVAVFENHIGPAIQSITEGVIALAETWVIDWEGIRTFLTKTWEQHLQPILMALIKFLSETLPPVIDNIRKIITTVFGDVVDWVGTNLPKIQDTIITVMSAIETVIGSVLDAIAGFWDTHGENIVTSVENAWNSIKTIVETMINVVSGLIEAAMQAINGDWEDAWDTIKDVIDTIWEGIKTIIGNAFDTLKNTIIPLALDAIKTAIETAWNFLKDTLVPGIWEGIGNVIEETFNTLKDITIPTALDDIETRIGTAWDSLKEWVKTTWENIKQNVKDAWDTLVNETLPTALDNIKTRIHAAWESLKEWVGTTWGNIQQKVQEVWDALRDEIIPNALEWIGQAIVTAWDTLYEWVGTKWEQIKEAIKNAWDALVNVVIPNALEWIGFAIVTAWDTLYEWVRIKWKGIKTAVSDVWDALVNVVIPIALDAIGDAIKIAWNWLKDTFVPAVWEGIKRGVKTIWDTLVNVIIPGALNAIGNLIENAWNWLKDTFVPTIWEGIKNTITDVWDVLVLEAIPAGLEGIGLAIQTAWNWLKDTYVPLVWEGIKLGVKLAWTALVDVVIPTALGAIGDLIETAWNWLKDTYVPLVWEGIKMGIKLMWFALVNVVIPTALTAVQSLIETAWNFLKDTLIPTIWEGIKTVIETAWAELWKVVQTGVDTVVDIVEGIAEAMYNAGKAIVANIKQGISDAWEGLTSWFRKKLADLASQLPWNSEPQDASSPLHGLGRAGAAIVTNLMEGMIEEIPGIIDIGHTLGDAFIDALRDSLEEGENLTDVLFKAAGVFGGLGGFAARLFEEQTLDPMRQNLDALNDQYDELLARQFETRQEMEEEGGFQEILLQYAVDRTKLSARQLWLAAEYHQVSQQLGETDADRAAAAAAYAEEQERILALQKAQQQLAFLEQQTKLLDLIAEYGLDAGEILGDMVLGVDANLADIIEAMTLAIQAIVDQVNEDLETSSPSKVFARIGAQLMMGLTEGVQAMAQKPLQAVMRATAPLAAAPAAMAEAYSGDTNAQSYTFNTTINNGMEQAQFETRVLRIVRGDMR